MAVILASRHQIIALRLWECDLELFHFLLFGIIVATKYKSSTIELRYSQEFWAIFVSILNDKVDRMK